MITTKHVFILGGTGYVGKAVVQELIKQNFRPVLLVRPQSTEKIPQSIKNKIDIIKSDVQDLLTYQEQIKEYQPMAFIYLVGLLRETPHASYQDYHYKWAKQTIDLAKKIGVRRFLLMSANGAKENGTEYQETKYKAEKYLKNTDLQWTIFRPSLIVGNDPSEKFVSMLIKLVHFPIVPLVGNGSFRLSPVYRGDVAKVFAQSLSRSIAAGKTYCLAGPKIYTFKELLLITAKAVGKKIVLVPVPESIALFVARICKDFPFFPVSDVQIRMLIEGNICKDNDVWKELGIQQTSFEEIITTYKMR